MFPWDGIQDNTVVLRCLAAAMAHDKSRLYCASDDKTIEAKERRIPVCTYS